MEQVQTLEQTVAEAIRAAPTTTACREIELKSLGKNGELTGLMRGIGQLPAEDRPRFGAAVNEARARLQSLLDARVEELLHKELAVRFESERLDVTMPGKRPDVGYEHVLQLTENRIKSVLGGLGFVYYEGPELEDFKYNFDALNYPPDHPAMDAQDTFYVSDDLVLRTQCTSFQGRLFETVEPPFRFFTVGRTYRNEAVDRTHGHTFHQVDAFMVDEGISMAHLKGTLDAFARTMFGDEAKVRFRPDFFPFVEPGVDYAISTPKLFNGKWVELGGAGLVHPNILERYGIDTERYSGFAFGLGVERIPMMMHGIDDLRYFLENDLRFLERYGREAEISSFRTTGLNRKTGSSYGTDRYDDGLVRTSD
ncbi:MAG: phenylalanine--tRNA ligase subunit alpha [Armatimonadetes bacterium]|nr:phenylalanine--tRNA ligase subunit alpha [Armatimonadota bacterium]